MTGFLNKIVLRLPWPFRPDSSRERETTTAGDALLQPLGGADGEAVEAALRAIAAAMTDVGADSAAALARDAEADAKAVEAAVNAITAAMAEDAAPVVSDAVNSARKFKLAMRLRFVAKIQACKKGRALKPVGKARANLKPKPVVAARPVKKRGPEPFASKVKRPVAKRPVVKIYIEKRSRPTAQILAFPVRKPLPGALRLRRAA